ncbi:MAG: response regulator transcription factor [Pseudomonadales bacterium]
MSDSAHKPETEALHGVTVLVVEDEQTDADRVIQAVESLGGQALHADALQGARHLIAEHEVDLIVLDRMLADGEHGLDLLSWFREIEAPVPQILVASRLATSDDHILGLDLGADDYIDKPFDPRELVARIRALLRRADAIRSPVSVVIWGRLEIRTLNGIALWNGERIKLRPQSFAVLSMLANLKGEYLSREALWREVWKKNKFLPPQDTVINTEISRLRSSLKALPDGPQVVAEELGFRLLVED